MRLLKFHSNLLFGGFETRRAIVKNVLESEGKQQL
jgi:hypothetical protein